MRYRFISITPASDDPDHPHKQIHTVRNNKSGALLGACVWDAPWKRYVCQFAPDTVWSDGCLQDIAAYLQDINSGQPRGGAR